MQMRNVELGTLVHPDDGVHPGVVMLHDVWGLSDHTRDLAGRLAAEGFAVLALDLYRREPGLEIQDPGAFIRELSDPQVEADVALAVRFLQRDPASAARKVGVVGFCMGGMYTLLAGCGVPDVAAVVPFYGLLSHQHGLLYTPDGLDPARKPRSPLDAARNLACPLLGFFGAEDGLIPNSDVEELRQRARATGQPVEIVVYPGAGHAFMNDTRPEAHRPEAAADAWRRMVAFLRAQL